MGNKKVIKNYIYNTSYQILVLLAPLITTPYTSRVLGATGVGIYSYAQSITTYFVLFGVVGSSLYGQREIAYVQDKPKERSVIFKEIIYFRFFTVCISLLIYLLMFAFGNKYTEVFQILILQIIAAAFDISWFFQGMEDFKKTVSRNIIIKVGSIILVFLLVKNANDVPIYALCMTLPVFLGNLSLWFYLKRYLVNVKINIRGVTRHLATMLILFIPQVSIEIYTILDKTMLGALVPDIAEVGYYTQSQKIVKLCLTLVTSLGTVMMPAMSLAYAKGNKNEIQNSISKSFQFVFFLGFPIMFGLIGISAKLVPWFFGPGFEKVTMLMILTTPIIVIIGISNVIGIQYLLPTKRQKAFTFSVITGAIVNFTLNLIFVTNFASIGATISTIFAELSVTIVQIFAVRKQLPVLSYLRKSIKYFISSVIMGGIVYLTGTIFRPTALTTCLQTIVGVIVYSGVMIIIKEELFMKLLSIFNKKLKFRDI